MYVSIVISVYFFLHSILEYNKLRRNSRRFHYTQDITIVFKRKGGRDTSQSHNEWLQTVPQAPDVLSMKFVSITSLLNGVTGTGFLSHAINLYLRCMKLHFKVVVLNICIISTAVYVCPKHRQMFCTDKPPIEDLRNFLEFQSPKEWAPAFGDLPLGPPRKQQGNPSLQFRLLGPKLQINTTPVSILIIPWVRVDF